MALRKLETQLLYPEMEQAIEAGNAEALAPLHRAAFFEKIPTPTATEIFQQMDVGAQREILDALNT